MTQLDKLRAINEFFDRAETLKALVNECIYQMRETSDQEEYEKLQVKINQHLEMIWILNERMRFGL